MIQLLERHRRGRLRIAAFLLPRTRFVAERRQPVSSKMVEIAAVMRDRPDVIFIEIQDALVGRIRAKV